MVHTSLKRARREPAAFTAVYEALAEDVLVFFARRTYDVEVARDLTAETFAQAFQHRRRYRGGTDAEAAGWIYGIARNLLSHYVRRGVVARRCVAKLVINVPAVGEDDYELIVELAGLADLRGRVAAAFASLDDDARAGGRLRIIDERPYAEVRSEERRVGEEG